VELCWITMIPSRLSFFWKSYGNGKMTDSKLQSECAEESKSDCQSSMRLISLGLDLLAPSGISPVLKNPTHTAFFRVHSIEELITLAANQFGIIATQDICLSLLC